MWIQCSNEHVKKHTDNYEVNQIFYHQYQQFHRLSPSDPLALGIPLVLSSTRWTLPVLPA